MNSFLNFYVMGSSKIDLFGISHLKVDFIPVMKLYTFQILGIFCTKGNVNLTNAPQAEASF